MSSRPRLAAVLVAAVCLTAACSFSTSSSDGSADLGDPGDCITVDLAVSPEKIQLMIEMAEDFNGQELEVDGTCIFARPQSKASGLGAQLLASTWDEEADGPRPVIWSPASSAWGSVLNQQLADQGKAEIVGEGVPFMVTPLVIAMPETMATAMGWPEAEIGWSDILTLATSPDGWSTYGHPEWGEFRLGKTSPNFSTSGLSALIAQTYAAAGKTENLSLEDLRRPAVIEFGEGVESAVVHYGDTTLTFLNNWYRADTRGSALGYVSAAAVEEKSVIDYNLGNPDGVLAAGEVARPPREPLVAVYPKEGTLYSDNPLFVLDAEWVSAEQKQAAELFIEFAQEEANQRKVLEFGFRPGNPAVALDAPITAELGVDPNQPSDLLEVPEPQVMTSLLELWRTQRKGAQVTLLLDVSGSMGELGDPETGDSKLFLAKQAIESSLDEFSANDQISLATFTLDEFTGDTLIEDLVPMDSASTNAERIRSALQVVDAQSGTPLYEAALTAYQQRLDDFDPERINALVILSDGVNDDINPGDDQSQLDDLLALLSRGSEGAGSRPVRVFPIAYGTGADFAVLQAIAEASSSAVYDASDPRSINKVFAQVISNF